MVCIICGASVHPTCFKSTVRKLSDYPSSCHDEVFCSSTCCTWHEKEGLDKEAVKKEREELSSMLKKQLVQLAATAQVCAVGGNSSYWKVVEKRFNEGFPDNSVDGPVFADKVHFMHPSIQEHHETVHPAIHGTFTS